MTRTVVDQLPPSLVHLFEPPEGFRGVFGWLCGYSADAAFLERAAERFTQLSQPRRAHAGAVSLVAMLDRGNPQISPVEVPGVLHVPWRHESERDFRLLHAKVAILGFSHEQREDQWCIRLIVSTGNWTGQTLEESLDLAWWADIYSGQLVVPDEGVRQVCADVLAAWSFLDVLRSRFDTRLLAAHLAEDRYLLSELSMRTLDAWITTLSGLAFRNSPQFFHNRGQSLLAQLPKLVGRISGTTARNYLALGSGFYEQSSKADEVPSVLRSIVHSLQGASGGRLLTAYPEVDVFVNPRACQSVATCLPAFAKCNWKVRTAHQPPSFGPVQRALHAKFLFSANRRENSRNCSSAWLYLGSGNLTTPGFSKAAHLVSGNLEAGVVINAPGLAWSSVSNVLPIQWATELGKSPESVSAGEPMEERQPTFFSAPVACLQYFEIEGGGCLRTVGDSTGEFEVIDQEGKPCARAEGMAFLWKGATPRQVSIQWEESDGKRQSVVPVLDVFGRVAGAELPALELEDAWASLSNFPFPPPEEEIIDRNPPGEGSAERLNSRKADASSYPIRTVMMLVENIAERQSRLQPADWMPWCIRLEQTLILVRTSGVVSEARRFGVNLLSPLLQPPFRPTFASTRDTEAGRMYEAVLDRVMQAWDMGGLPDFGRGA